MADQELFSRLYMHVILTYCKHCLINLHQSGDGLTLDTTKKDYSSNGGHQRADADLLKDEIVSEQLTRYLVYLLVEYKFSVILDPKK